MSWRDNKDYYKFSEILDRWKPLRFQDITYLAERDRLEIQTWLSDIWVGQYEFRKVEGGDVIEVQTGIVPIKGYVIVDANELRKVFLTYRTKEKAEVRKFRSVDGRYILSIPVTLPACSMNTDALEIALEERLKFEKQLNIKRSAGSADKKRADAQSVGRPSYKILHVQHLEKHWANGYAQKTLKAEAKSIRSELGELANESGNDLKTIENNIRERWRIHKGEARP